MKFIKLARAVQLASFIDEISKEAQAQPGWQQQLGGAFRNISDGIGNSWNGTMNSIGHNINSPFAATGEFFRSGAGYSNGGAPAGWRHQQQLADQQGARANWGERQQRLGLGTIGNLVSGGMGGFSQGFNGTPGAPQQPQPSPGGQQQFAAAPQPTAGGLPSGPQSPYAPNRAVAALGAAGQAGSNFGAAAGAAAAGAARPAPSTPTPMWQGNGGQQASWQSAPMGSPSGSPITGLQSTMPQAPAPQQQQPDYMAQFYAGTKSKFDPNSALDRSKMEALRGGQGNWASNPMARQQMAQQGAQRPMI